MTARASFTPAWYLESKKGYQSLSAEEKSRLGNLVGQRRRESEEGWESMGRRLLSVLQGATDMLVCAEDLGDVPRCVPRVLDGLGILGLRIVRWAREYETTPPAGRRHSSRPPATRCSPSARRRSTTPRPCADGGRRIRPSASCSSVHSVNRGPARPA